MKTVFFAAGHSEKDPGATGKTSDGAVVREAWYALQLRDRLSGELALRGIPHRIDGRPGTNDPLRNSINAALRCDGVRVEFHLNSVEIPAANGTEVLASTAHKAVAQSLAAVVSGVLGTRLRGERGWKSESSGQHHRLGFVSTGKGLVCELAFVSNPTEADRLVQRFPQLVTALADWFEEQSRGDVPAERKTFPGIPYSSPPSAPAAAQKPAAPAVVLPSVRDVGMAAGGGTGVVLAMQGQAWLVAHGWQVATVLLAVACFVLAVYAARIRQQIPR